MNKIFYLNVDFNPTAPKPERIGKIPVHKFFRSGLGPEKITDYDPLVQPVPVQCGPVLDRCILL